jgi:hypothetical protein
VAKEEKNEERKLAINAEIEKMLGALLPQPGLDTKSRDIFN